MTKRDRGYHAGNEDDKNAPARVWLDGQQSPMNACEATPRMSLNGKIEHPESALGRKRATFLHREATTDDISARSAHLIS